MWQADWGKGRNPPMRNTAEHRDRIYSRQKSLKQIKAGRGRLQHQNPYETIRFFRWERTTRDPTHHSKQGKPKGFCPDCFLYLQGIFQLSYLTFLRQALVRLTAQCYSNSFNIFNKKTRSTLPAERPRLHLLLSPAASISHQSEKKNRTHKYSQIKHLHKCHGINEHSIRKDRSPLRLGNKTSNTLQSNYSGPITLARSNFILLILLILLPRLTF